MVRSAIVFIAALSRLLAIAIIVLSSATERLILFSSCAIRLNVCYTVRNRSRLRSVQLTRLIWLCTLSFKTPELCDTRVAYKLVEKST